MTRVFDSGSTVPVRTAIKDAFVTALLPLLAGPSNPTGFLAELRKIGFLIEIKDYDAIDLLKNEIRSRSPAIVIAMGSRTSDPAGSIRRTLGDLDVLVYFIDAYRGSVTAGRTSTDAAALADDRQSPGIDAMLELAFMLLHGADLGIRGVQPPRHVRDDEIDVTADLTIWRSRFSVAAAGDVNPDRNVTQLLESLHTTLRHPGDTGAILGGVPVVLTEQTDV